MLGTKVMPMRILALETTDRIGSVAALSGSNPLLQLALHSGQRSAQALAPAVRDLLEQVGWMPDEVELVAVSVGPGSFTGLRVGVTMAKVFAYAVGAEVLGINTLEAIANAGVAKAKTPLAPMREGELSGMVRLTATMDAQRGDIVVQSFTGKLGEFLVPEGPQTLVAADPWIAQLSAESLVTGPGLAKWADRLPLGVRTLDQTLWDPTATAVGLLADWHYARGRRDDLWKLVPHYSRRSAAEEKWDLRPPAGHRQA